MNDTYGPISQNAFAYYDPDTASLKTCQGTFDLDLTPSSLTLPGSGSMRNGQLYERPTSEPHTNGTGFSSLLPTPTARDWKDTGDLTKVDVAKCRLPVTLFHLEHGVSTPTLSDGGNESADV